ncbi:MAG: DUF547 domain-containing protein, partial [Thermoanaerobaculia bacterium]
AGLPDPAPFDAVLAERARGGGFDYRGVTGQDRKRLAAYLSNLGDADPKAMTGDERKAFSINAYNAMAIAVVLDRYPVKSIRDIDGAFTAIRKKIGGEMLTLDEIENRLRDTKDARIHFAIVCASKSCPPLASRSYTAAGLDAALDAQGRAFVNDPSKNAFDRKADRIALSKIFDWNRKEFERDGGSLLKYVSRFVSEPALSRWVATRSLPPEFLEYDWSLNQP